jgi:purine-binding chemotaxis protein CheW
MKKNGYGPEETIGQSQTRQRTPALRAGARVTPAKQESEGIVGDLQATVPLVASAEKVMPIEKMRAILEERARALSKSTEVKTGESMQLVVFSLANETYGIATDYVREVQPLRNVSPVPCTPELVVGVINIRGSIYSVIDIRSFFGVQKKDITDLTKVILVSAAGLEVGILADDVKGATSLPLSEIKAALAAQGSAKDEYIQGVTKDMLIILNLEAVLRDERVIVRQEVG